MRQRPLRVLLLALGIVGLFAPWARAVHEETDMGEIESRPAPVSRRECVDGANAGALCNEDGDCPGSTCQDRNIFNITVSVRFNASGAQLTTIQNAMTGMAASLFDVTDGQAQIGQVTILNNSTGSGGTIWVTSAFPCSGGAGCLCADSGHWASGGKIQAGIGCLGNAGAGEGLAHEFVHLVFDARDEYEARAAGCGALTGPAQCPTAAGEERCLMDVGGLNGGGTELCWTGNHEPALVTEQSRCRSNRSCWEQVVWSWPNTFQMPAGAPDPAAGGATVDPVAYLQPAATARIVLVLDNSGSMSAESPTRIARLRTAALDFVNLAQNGVELGIVSFSTTATDQVAIAPLGADRSAYTTAINGLSPTFRTNIGDGLQHAKDMIAAAGGVTANTAIVLMTDGVNNEPAPDPAADLQARIDMLLMQGIPVYVTCTGSDLGLASQCAEIAAGTMGTYVDSESGAALPPAFGLFHELIMGRQIAASRIGSLLKADSYRVAVEPNVRTASFLLQWQNASTEAQLLVQDPAGVDYTGAPMPLGQFVRVDNPMPGEWTVFILPLTGQGVNDTFVSRAFLANQDLSFRGQLRHRRIEPGEPFVVYAHPLFQGPVGGVQVSGTVRKPDGTRVPIMLVDTGQTTDSGDDFEGDGVYTATFADTAQRGAYAFELRAVAVNAFAAGHSNDPTGAEIPIPNFTREVTLSGTVNDRVGSDVCVGNGYAEPGAEVAVPIVLGNGDGVAGFQFDLGYDPATLTPVGVSLGADTMAAGGWGVSHSVLAPGTVRILGASNPPAPLGPGVREVALLKFQVSASAPLGVSPLGIRDCILSDPRGLRLPCHPCGEPGGVIVRPAGKFVFRPLSSPVGADRFDPLPFAVGVEAVNSMGGLASGYNGTAAIRIPAPVCDSTLVPNAMAFTNGVGSGVYRVACCVDPLLPATTFDNSLEVSDPANALSGLSDPFQGVAKGDLDASNAVDVLDVVRTVRLALNQPVGSPPSIGFQRWAANMLDASCGVDAAINVLDVIRVENKALLLPPLCPCGGARSGAQPGPGLATQSGDAAGPILLRIAKDGRHRHSVLVEGARDLAGFQLELRAVGPKSEVAVDGLTVGGGWQVASQYEAGVLKVLAWSTTATGISGDGPVLRIDGAASPRITGVVAADSRGREVPVR